MSPGLLILAKSLLRSGWDFCTTSCQKPDELLRLPIYCVIADLQTAAAAIAQEIEVFPAGTSRDIDAAFEAVVQKQADALWVSPGSLFLNHRHAQPCPLSGANRTSSRRRRLTEYDPSATSSRNFCCDAQRRSFATAW
jgi:hypothetical protein